MTGQARVHARGQTEWQDLMVTDDLDSGDWVQTAGDGRVEILLNPGSFLRVGGNSEVELANNSLENLEVRLLRGTAIVEATGGDGTEVTINISTPHTKLAIVRDGLYRLNVVPNDGTELIVRKGRVILNDSHTKIKAGNKVIFSATNISVAKLTSGEKKTKDEVENWSKDRAETVAKANRRISDRMLTSAFSSYGDPLWGTLGYRNAGIWFFNSRAGCYTFVPFGGGWGSPYGGSYQTAIVAGYTGTPIVTRNPQGGWSNNGGGNGSNNGGSNNNTTTSPVNPTSGSPIGARPGVSSPTMGARDMDLPVRRNTDRNVEPGRPN